MVVECRYEDDMELDRSQPIEQIERIPLVHFDIHEDQIRLGVMNERRACFHAIRRSDHLDLRTIVLQERLENAVAVRFIID